MENYTTIIEHIEVQEAAPNPPAGQGRLSDGEIIAQRNVIFGELTDGEIGEIIEVLLTYMSIDIMRADEILVRVVFRDMAHFDMNPALDMRKNSCDMFVYKIEYNEDDQSFTLHLREANVHVDDLAIRLFPWRKIRRTNKSHHIVIRQGESMTAPYITPSTFVLLKNTVLRYDAYERGLREKVGVMNRRKRNEEAKRSIDDIQRVAEKHGIDIIQQINKL